ncbi:MAG: hypothetical protein ACFE9I_05975 [Candidatus Hermodarchaeota archaeon]
MWFIAVLDSQLSNFETQWGLGNYDDAREYAFYCIGSYEHVQGLFRLYFNATIHLIFANTHITGYSEPKAITIAREVTNF